MCGRDLRVGDWVWIPRQVEEIPPGIYRVIHRTEWPDGAVGYTVELPGEYTIRPGEDTEWAWPVGRDM